MDFVFTFIIIMITLSICIYRANVSPAITEPVFFAAQKISRPPKRKVRPGVFE